MTRTPEEIAAKISEYLDNERQNLGFFSRASDVIADAIRAERERAREEAAGYGSFIPGLVEGRRAAIEECARVAETAIPGHWAAQNIAAALRALAEPKGKADVDR